MDRAPLVQTHSAIPAPRSRPLFGRASLLRNLSGRLRRQVAMTLYGPSGMGKRTVARALAARLRQGAFRTIKLGLPDAESRNSVHLLPPGVPVTPELLSHALEAHLRIIATATAAPAYGLGHALSPLALPLPHQPMSSAPAGELFVWACRQLRPTFDPETHRERWQDRLEATHGVPRAVLDAAARGLTRAQPSNHAKRVDELSWDPVLRVVSAFPGGASAQAVFDLVDAPRHEVRRRWHDLLGAGLMLPAPPAPSRRALLHPDRSPRARSAERQAAREWLTARARAHVRHPDHRTWRWIEDEKRNLHALARHASNEDPDAPLTMAWCALALQTYGPAGLSSEYWHQRLEALGDQADEHTELRGRLLVALASAERGAGRLLTAEEAAADGLRLLESPASGLALLELGRTVLCYGSSQVALECFQEALESAPPLSPLRARALGALGRAATKQGAHDEADRALDEAFEIARALRAPSLVASVLYDRAATHEHRDERWQALLFLQAMRRVSSSADHRELRVRATIRIARILLLEGEVGRAIRELGAARDSLDGCRAVSLEGRISGWLGIAVLLDGSPHRAEFLLRRACRDLRRGNRAVSLGWFLGFMAVAQSAEGRAHEAIETLNEARAQHGRESRLIGAYFAQEQWIRERRRSTSASARARAPEPVRALENRVTRLLAQLEPTVGTTRPPSASSQHRILPTAGALRRGLAATSATWALALGHIRSVQERLFGGPC